MIAIVLAALLGSSALAGVKPVEPRADLQSAYAPRRVALLVGVDEYGDPELQSLSFAGKDAADLGRVLGDRAYGAFDAVHVVTGREATTAEALRRAIRDVTADLQRDDTFLLYLSGHGTLTFDAKDGTRLWFLPSDGMLQKPEGTSLAVAWLEERLRELQPRRRVLILDTCHNGRSKSALASATQSRLAGLKGDPPPPRSTTEVSESEARLYAADYYQPAMEDPDLGNGVYTHFLLTALTSARGVADLNRDGLVDVTEAHAYARERTERHTGGLQMPRIETRIVGNEAIFLSGDPGLRRRAEAALISAYDALLGSARLLVNGTPRGVLPGLVALDPGRQHIEVQSEDGRTILQRRIRVAAGDYLAVEDFLRPPGPRVAVHVGGSGLHGPASEITVPLLPEVELAWTPEVRGWRLRPELHARGTFGAGRATLGPLDLQGPRERVLAGNGFVGGGFGVPLGTPRLTLGPEFELGTVWRRVPLESGGATDQLAPAGAPGLRLSGVLPTGDHTHVVLRYDVRVLTWRYDDAWTSAIAHGAALGFAFR